MSEQLHLKTEVLELLSKLPLRGTKRLPSGATAESIDAVERALGFDLPNEYREWLSISNGPPVVPGGMVGIGKKTKTNEILGLMSAYPDWLSHKYLPVTGDGFGNDYVLAAGSEYGGWRPILFLETQEASASPSFIVASDLWHFLKAFFLSELGDTWWPFDRIKTLSFDPDIERVPNVKLPWCS